MVQLLPVDNAAYAQYGVVSRKLLLHKEGWNTCVVMCKGWPCWVWAALNRGYRVKLAIVNNLLWKPFILKLSPSTEVLGWTPSMVFTCPNVTAVFSDYDLKGSLVDVWTPVSDLVVLPRASRAAAPGWKHLKLQMMHVDFGGITNGQWWVHVYQPLSKPDLILGLQAQRDARTVLDCMANNGRPCKAPPDIDITDKPSVVTVRPGTYHCAGLLPWAGPSPWVITPNVYSKTKWCCRMLTSDERFFSRDITKTMLEQLSGVQLKELLADENFLPDKCCIAILDSYLHHQVQAQKPLPNTESYPATSFVPVKRQLAEQELKQMQVATKADDSEVPVHIWDHRILPNQDQAVRGPILNALRGFALRWWCKHTRRDFLRWFKEWYPTCLTDLALSLPKVLRHRKARIDWECGRDCIRRSTLASWWEWDAGSRPFHWHWPEEYQVIIRDGLRPWFHKKPADVTIPQRGEPDPFIREQVRHKLEKVRDKGYLADGHVRALTSFFSVPKGDKDV